MRKRALLALLLISAARAAHATPETAELRAQEAGSALLRGDVTRAVALFNEALAEPSLPNERRAAMLADRGVAHFRLGQMKPAIDDFNKAAQLFPENGAIYNNRGNVLLWLKLPAEALKDFNRAILLAPGYSVAFNNRANALLSLGRIDEAVTDFSTAIELSPQSAAALSGRGRAHVARRRAYLAMRDFTRAVSLDPKLPASYRNRAEVHALIDDHNSAVEDLSRAIAFDPSSAELLLARGRAYLAASNLSAAERDFSSTIELKPNAADAYAWRGLARARQSAFDDAMSDYAKAFEIDPKAVTALINRAATFRQMEQPEAGMRDIERALKIDASNPEALRVRGQLQEALEHNEAAITDYRRAVSLDPRQREAWEALERLAGEQRPEDQEIVGLGLSGWRVFQAGDGRYFARHESSRLLKVPLEMADNGTPKLTGWEERKAPLSGVGVLTYEAGVEAGKSGPETIEHAAVVDLIEARVIAIEPYRRGAATSSLKWDGGRLTVAAVDGLTSEYLARDAKPSETQKTPKVVSNDGQGRRRDNDVFDSRRSSREWVPWERNAPSWQQDQRQYRPPPRNKPKTLFDLLFKN